MHAGDPAEHIEASRLEEGGGEGGEAAGVLHTVEWKVAERQRVRADEACKRKEHLRRYE